MAVLPARPHVSGLQVLVRVAAGGDRAGGRSRRALRPPRGARLGRRARVAGARPSCTGWSSGRRPVGVPTILLGGAAPRAGLLPRPGRRRAGGHDVRDERDQRRLRVRRRALDNVDLKSATTGGSAIAGPCCSPATGRARARPPATAAGSSPPTWACWTPPGGCGCAAGPTTSSTPAAEKVVAGRGRARALQAARASGTRRWWAARPASGASGSTAVVAAAAGRRRRLTNPADARERLRLRLGRAMALLAEIPRWPRASRTGGLIRDIAIRQAGRSVPQKSRPGVTREARHRAANSGTSSSRGNKLRPRALVHSARTMSPAEDQAAPRGVLVEARGDVSNACTATREGGVSCRGPPGGVSSRAHATG